MCNPITPLNDIDIDMFGDEKTHICSNKVLFQTGKFQCKQNHIRITRFRDPYLGIDCKTKDLEQLINLILSKESLIVVNGQENSGISELVKEALRYFADRKYFQMGIVMLNLRAQTESYQVRQHLKNLVLGSLEESN